MNDKARKLARLRARMVKALYLTEWREVWFFPRFDGVDGWQGTQGIMFVDLNPSTGWFPTRADQLLYRQLRLKGFRRAHLTDLIKEREQGLQVENIERDPVRMGRYRRYLAAEIKIIRPRLIVAMGRRAYRILTTWLPSDPRVKRIRHYAARFSTGATRRGFAADMTRIRTEYGRGPTPR